MKEILSVNCGVCQVNVMMKIAKLN